MSKKNEYESFGGFLVAMREKCDLTLRELARQLGISAPYLSDVEKDRTSALTKDRLDKVAEILSLSSEEKATMYDLAGKQRRTIAPDLPEYIMGRSYVAAALRTARDLNANEAEWLKFVEELKKRGG